MVWDLDADIPAVSTLLGEHEVELLGDGLHQGEEGVLEGLAEELFGREAWPCDGPPMSLLIDATRGHDAVDMGVVGEVGAGSVDDGHDAGLGAEVLRVIGDLLDGSRRRGGEQRVHLALVSTEELVELLRDLEDEVEVRDWEELSLLELQPLVDVFAHAPWTGPVPARVEDQGLSKAVLALDDLPSEGRGSASHDGGHGLALLDRHAIAHAGFVGRSELPEGARHGALDGGTSSALVVEVLALQMQEDFAKTGPTQEPCLGAVKSTTCERERGDEVSQRCPARDSVPRDSVPREAS